MLYVSHYVTMTEVLGPGRRFALWMQGCERRCPGCINPQGQPVGQGGTYYSVAQMAEQIINAAPGLNGITVSGGEPLLQAKPLMRLLTAVRSETALDVMLYTGDTLAQVYERLGEEAERFLSLVDILVDGSYVQEENHNEMYRGSANQKIWFLSEKYRPFAARIEQGHNRSIEWHGSPDGSLWMAGIPPAGFDRQLAQTCSEWLNTVQDGTTDTEITRKES